MMTRLYSLSTSLYIVLFVTCVYLNNNVCNCLSSSSSSSLPFVLLSTPQSPSGPRLLERFTDQTLDPGPSVSLKCIASGHPLPQVTWLLNGSPVPENSRFRTGDYVTRDLLVVSYVNISSITSFDGGLYVSSVQGNDDH